RARLRVLTQDGADREPRNAYTGDAPLGLHDPPPPYVGVHLFPPRSARPARMPPRVNHPACDAPCRTRAGLRPGLRHVLLHGLLHGLLHLRARTAGAALPRASLLPPRCRAQRALRRVPVRGASGGPLSRAPAAVRRRAPPA